LIDLTAQFSSGLHVISETYNATILIVDDTPANLGVIVESLEGHGFRVVVAQRGEEALQRADYVQPDLVLLDVMMPGMDGFEICRRLKAQPGTQDIPVIFMTSLASVEDKVTGFAVGGVDYVTKPLHVEEVRARVSTHLSLRAMQKELERQNAQLQQYQQGLERLVAERTAELDDANRSLRAEVGERKRAEEEVRQLNVELEARVTERTAQLTAINEELEAFSYSVSHDLRAPLRAITGFTRILTESHRADLTPQDLDYLNKVLLAAQRMDTLIQDLLNYARTGRAVRAVPVPLAPLVHQLESTFGTRAAATGAHLEVTRPLATPLGDPTLIEQILTNLLDNALKYRCREGTPEVRLSVTPIGEHVLLQVVDNGIGIAPEYQERIFQMFQRLHSQRDYPGTGIGLAIVAKAVRAMGGGISVESSPGQGSTFSVRLPAAIVTAGRAQD
jgi:signal transduction histidine kinase